MKIKYKRQKFQADAAKAVVDVFKDQPYTTPSYMIDQGKKDLTLFENLEGYDDSMGWNNAKIIPSLSDKIILERINKIQREGQIKPSEKLIDRSNGYNLSIEMETGVGKTYTYIKTMYELNKAYGWSKFIVVVQASQFVKVSTKASRQLRTISLKNMARRSASSSITLHSFLRLIILLLTARSTS